MNNTKLFIEAILGALKLESNIYIMGAVEKLVERLETSDYQTFIAYLGERNAEYEKPIESIAKGVDEFYMMKTRELRSEVHDKTNILFAKINSMAGMYNQHKAEGKEFFISKVINKATEEKMIDDFELSTLKRVGTLEYIFTPRRAKGMYMNQLTLDWLWDEVHEAMVDLAGIKKSVVETLESGKYEIENKKLLAGLEIKRLK